MNDAIRNEEKKLRLPVNNAHRQTLEMAEKIPGPRRQPPAETEFRKWNAKSGIPWKVVRLFRKISGLTARSICGYTGRTGNFAFLIATLIIWRFWRESISRGFVFTMLIRKYEKRAFYFVILALLNFV